MGLQELGGWEDSHKDTTNNFIIKFLFLKQMKHLKIN